MIIIECLQRGSYKNIWVFESISLVEPDSQTRPYDEGDYIGEKEGEVSVVTSRVWCGIVLAGLATLIQTGGGAVFGLELPLGRRLNIDTRTPVPDQLR